MWDSRRGGDRTWVETKGRHEGVELEKTVRSKKPAEGSEEKETVEQTPADGA